MKSRTPVIICSILTITLMLGACDLGGGEDTSPGSGKQSPAPTRPITQTSPPYVSTYHSFPEQRDWGGVRRLLLDYHLTSQLPTSSGVKLSDFGGVNLPILSLTVDGQELEFNKAGQRLNRQLYSSNYDVCQRDGVMYLVPFGDILSEDSFERLREVCQHGGSVMRLSLPQFGDDPAQTAAQWLPGTSAQTSYVVESLGRLKSPPPGLMQWRRQYSGNYVYRICKVDPKTGREGQQLAWVVDVLSKRVEFVGKSPSHYILKRFFPEEGVNELPNFLVAQPDGMVRDPDGREFHYFGEVVGDTGEPVSAGVFRRFCAGPLIADVNAPEPTEWGNTPHGKR